MLGAYERLQMVLVSALLAATSIGALGQSKSRPDPLKPYTTCNAGDDLEIKDITRWPSSSGNYREVTTDKGTERVSVVDGYRVMFAYKDVRYYFANVKIEQSEAQSYAQDKERIINELKHIAANKQATVMLYTDKTMLHGFEHYGVDRAAIDVGGTVGIHVLFDDAHQHIITIYFLNQEKKNRHFNNIDEYHALRDNFLEHYAECLQGVAIH